MTDRQRYIGEGYRQLNDTSVYLGTHATAINVIEEDIQHLADQLHIQELLLMIFDRLPFVET